MPAEIDDFLRSELSGDLASERAAARADAVTVLGRLGTGTAALEALKNVADRDPEPDVRKMAHRAYGELYSRVREQVQGEVQIASGGQLDPGALQRFLADPSPILRIQAILKSIQLSDNRAMPLLLARLEVEPDDWVLATLVRAVGHFGNATHVPRIQSLLRRDESPRLVANTVEAIA